jgi:hypothetical protein
MSTLWLNRVTDRSGVFSFWDHFAVAAPFKQRFCHTCRNVGRIVTFHLVFADKNMAFDANADACPGAWRRGTWAGRQRGWTAVRVGTVENLRTKNSVRERTHGILQVASYSPEKQLFWALLASGQISMRKVDGWKTFSEELSASSAQLVDLAA